MRVLRRIFLATALLGVACAPAPPSEPALARVHTSDVLLFWEVLDSADAAARRAGAEAPDPAELARRLDEDYLAAGTQGLRDFVPGRILGGEELAAQVLARRADYDHARSYAARIPEVEPEIQAIFQRLRRAYPGAVLPDVYFVVGRFNSGGTTSDRGLLIGAEMLGSLEEYPALVAHELVHYQQPDRARPTLLTQALHEGTAEFVGERIAAEPHRSPRYAYGLAHEAELWEEFRRVMNGREFGGWLYGGQPDGVPADLGYFLGYRIVEAYWDRVLAGGGEGDSVGMAAAPDTAVVLEEILRWDDAQAFLEASGYGPGELSRVLAASRRAVGLAGRLPGIVAEASVTGPGGSFRTHVASRGDGAAWMVQTPNVRVRVPGRDPWGVEERIPDPAAGEARALVRGHELHALALFPETRLADPVLLGTAPFRGEDALAVRWRTTGDRTLLTFYSPSDTLPLGMRAEWTRPVVEGVFHQWSRVESGPFEGLRVFRAATFLQGDDVYRYRYDRVAPGEVPDSLPEG